MVLQSQLCPWADNFAHMLAVRPLTLPRGQCSIVQMEPVVEAC